jgi:hypothetical protein
VIQLLGVQVNGISQTGKIAANEKEQAAGFEAILQLIGQIEEENTESKGLVNQLPFLQQNPLMVPLLKQPTVQEPTASEEQGEVIFAKQQNAPVLESVVKESVTSVVEIGPDAAALSAGAAAEGVNGEAKAVMVRVVNGAATEEEMLKGFIQNSEDSGRNETPNAVQTNKNSPAEFFTTVHSSPATQPLISSEKAVPAQIVHANQWI